MFHIDNVHISVSESLGAQLLSRLAGHSQEPAEGRLAAVPALLDPWPGLAESAYAGIVRGRDGAADGRLVLLADFDTTLRTWHEWMEIEAARTDGARIAGRWDGALLYANCSELIDTSHWYHLRDEVDASCAWFQYFTSGNQLSTRKSSKGRARFVRRFPL